MNFRIQVLILIIFFITGCKVKNKDEILSMFNLKPTTQKKLFEAYQHFIDAKSSADFPLNAFGQDAYSGKISIYTQRFSAENDLYYLPATLWQAYSLNGSSEWRNYAQNFSEILKGDKPSRFLNNVAVMQNILLTTFLISKDQEYASIVIKILSDYVAHADEGCGNDSILEFNDMVGLDHLFENQVMFFASKATGDPVYSKFALKNSNFIIDNYFKNSQTSEFLHGFTKMNDNQVVVNKSLSRLKVTYADLAIGLYGFTFLSNETGMDIYHQLSNDIAPLFVNEFNLIEKENLKPAINSEMDLLTQTLACIALFDMGDRPENHYREMSLMFYDHIIGSLSSSVKSDDINKFSFRLFYYLFEFERRKKGGLV